MQLRGTFLSLWDDLLPPIPEHRWRENLAMVAAWLAEFGGTPLAQPPRMDWKAPATIGEQPASRGDETDTSPGEQTTAPEQTTTEQAHVDQASTEQATTQQVITERATAESAIGDRATRERAR
jgi:hypothetical protein